MHRPMRASRLRERAGGWPLAVAVLGAVASGTPVMAAPAARPTTAPVVYKVPVGVSPVLGPADALATVVVFGGFQCRFTQRALQTLMALQRTQPRVVRLVFKHYPLAMHPRSATAAKAAVAAHQRARFWPFVQRLQAGGFALADPDLERAGVAAGLKAGRVLAALRSAGHPAAVGADLGLGAKLRVTATPTIFINGVRVNGGALPAATFRGLLAQATAQARGALRKPGVTRKNLYDRLIAAGIQPGPLPRPRSGGGLVDLSRLRGPQPRSRSGGRASAQTLRLTQAPAHGPEDALVTVILFTNFNCGYGNYIWDAYRQASREQPGMYRLYFVHHAVGRSNTRAKDAAEASLAAQAAGKFWEMAEILFQNRYNLTVAKLEEYATELGLDGKAFATVLRKRPYRPRIWREVEEARRFLKGSTACPTLWVNGKVHAGYLSTWRVKSFLQNAARDVRGLRVRPLP